MSRSAMRLAQMGWVVRGSLAPHLPRCHAKIAHGLLGLVLLSACGVAESDPHPPGPFLDEWTEVTRIGEYETPVEEVFGSIRAAALIESGGVVILDGQGARAVGFGVDGAHAFTFGRRGPGPEEFEDPSALFRIAADTLAFNFSHRVLGAAVVPDSHLALSISVTVPRGQEPPVEGLLALLDLTTGSQTRRDEFGGIVLSGLGRRVAVAYRDPFPTLAILARGES